MRYPVSDEFAVALSEKLYDLLADKGQPLPRAVAMTLTQLARDYPALSAGDAGAVRRAGRRPHARRPEAHRRPAVRDRHP